MRKTNAQTDFVPEMNRRIERHEAPALFAKLKADVELLTFATDVAADDAGNAVAALCRVSNQAWLRHDGNPCNRCGFQPQPIKPI